jgi:hypothetical protein
MKRLQGHLLASERDHHQVVESQIAFLWMQLKKATVSGGLTLYAVLRRKISSRARFEMQPNISKQLPQRAWPQQQCVRLSFLRRPIC